MKQERLTIRIDEDEKRKAQDKALQIDMSLSQVLRILLRKWLRSGGGEMPLSESTGGNVTAYRIDDMTPDSESVSGAKIKE